MSNQKYIIKENPQGSEAWLLDRLGHFTGTDAQAVANNGVGLTSLAYEKAAERITHKFKEPYSNADMLRGQELEAMARNSYELESGIVAKQVGFIELSEYAGASIDGFIGEDEILELKCPNDANFVRFMYERKIAPVYVWQMQHYLYVTDRKYCNFVLFNPNFPKSLIITKVERDEEAISKIQLGLNCGIELMKKILAKI